MKTLLATALALLACAATAEDAGPQNPLVDGPTWEALRGDVLGEAVPADGAALFEVDAPYRADEAAIVPIAIRQTDPNTRIDAATVVIDENPAPVAAEFAFGPAMSPLDLEFRVRVNQYSNVRVIAEVEGAEFMSGRFVKASGGCSAPATRDPEQALAGMGDMRVRSFDLPAAGDGSRREAQIMVRHPNYSGLQRDQITQLFIPAHFIDELSVWQGDELLFSMTGGISISENPAFRFLYTDDGSADFRVRAHDTDGNVFERTLPKDAAS